ncbi:CAAX protease self-immunity-domain-containing protein [Limtongia smithiae]|uniref:CAAX protease self-immunity-domain-containing protein n=1 Tax=Limtongia smithiae TaxID=1125753 RepID=UPI0034D01249
MVSSTQAFLVCTGLTIAYVGVLYIHPNSRPSPMLSRNDDIVIKTRVTAILLSSLVSALVSAWVINGIRVTFNPLEVFVLLGFFPLPSLYELLVPSVVLTGILFIGPLWEKVWYSGRGWRELLYETGEGLASWIGIRNYIIGPLTEELVFRVCIISIELASRMSPTKAMFISPLYFATAHIHHAYEVYVSNPEYLYAAIGSSIVQFTITTVFGWYAAYIFLRTGTLWQPFIVHAFCNSMGVPKLGLRLDGPVVYTYVYHGLLVLGLVLFIVCLKPLSWTEGAMI